MSTTVKIATTQELADELAKTVAGVSEVLVNQLKDELPLDDKQTEAVHKLAKNAVYAGVDEALRTVCFGNNGNVCYGNGVHTYHELTSTLYATVNQEKQDV